MTAPPTFSSFPELPQLRQQPNASSSGTQDDAVPTFSSFPELPSTVTRRLKDDEISAKLKRSSRSPDSKGHGRSRRGDEVESSRKHRDREERGSRSERSHRDEEGRRSKHRRTSRERDRHARDREKEDRRAKEQRRERERKEAKDLIAGVKPIKDFRKDEEEVLELDKKRRLKEDEAPQKTGEDDGSRWYDAPAAKSARPSRSGRPPTQPTEVGFFIDTRPDLGNIMYGGLNTFSIPTFSRGGYGHVIGLPEAFKIVRETEKRGKLLEVAVGGHQTTPRYTALTSWSSTTDHLQRILLHPPKDAPVDHLAEFLPLTTQERPPSPKALSIYRNFNDGSEQPLRLDLSPADAEIQEAKRDRLETLEEKIRRQTTEYERLLKANPARIDDWIKYSSLHLQLSPATADSSTASSVTTSRANAEITLSILSRALDAHRDNNSSVELHLAYLRTAETFWTARKVTERWKWVLTQVGGQAGIDGSRKMELWLKYVDWREGQGFGAIATEGSGGVDEVVDVYIECLNMLRHGSMGGELVEDGAWTHLIWHEGRLEDVEGNMLYLLQRACLFLKHAGYTERATAIYQAMLELTFFKPDQLRRKEVPSNELEPWRHQLLSSLEQFWDAEVPRIGEINAVGWRNASDRSTSLIPAPIPVPSLETKPEADAFEQWFDAERFAERHASRPALATDLDVDDEDPYRVILFADVEPFVFILQSSEARLHLVYSFLSFLGLPFTPPGSSTSSAAARDPHLHWAMSRNDTLRSRMWPERQDLKPVTAATGPPSSIAPSPFDCPVKSWLSDTSDQFARSGQWFRLLEPGDLDHVDIDMARNVLKQLRPLVYDPAFTLAAFAFEASISPKNAVKLAKDSLATDRDNLILWNGYAKLSHQRGKVAEARVVYVTALRAALSRLHEAQSEGRTEDAVWLEEDLETLWAGWAEMECIEGEDVRCQEVLVHAFGVRQEDIESEARPEYEHKRPSPDRILKALKRLESTVGNRTKNHLVLKALFAYQFRSLEDSLATLAEYVDAATVTPLEQEAALQFRAQLVYNHSLRSSLPASTSRKTLEQSIELFPSNTSFLSLYLWGESHGKVYGRVRGTINDLTKVDEWGSTKGGILAFLWGAWAEARASERTFWEKNSAGQERVRVLLDKAISSPDGKRSALLWKLYIEFEALSGREVKAKQLCYRAVASTGGNKDLYMMPFSPVLRSQFTARELKDWAELMTERGVRIRIPFERHWTNEDEPSEMEVDNDDDDEAMVDDPLAFLRERQKMMPY